MSDVEKPGAPSNAPSNTPSTALAPQAATAVTTPKPVAVTTPAPMLKATVMAAPPTWSAARPIWLGMLTILVLVGGFGTWSTMTSIEGAVVAPGVIEVEQNRQVVQHPDGGVVGEIAVVEGQSVKAGDLLIRLDGNLIHSQLTIAEGQLFEAMARESRLEAERDDLVAPIASVELTGLVVSRPEVADQVEGQRRLFLARRETLARQTEELHKRIGQISDQVIGIDAQMAARSEQLTLLKSETDSQKELLAKGLTQSVRVLDLERESANLKGDLGELASSRAQAEGRATEIELEILRLAAARREEANAQLRDIGPTILELVERRRALTEQVARLDIRAPVSGIILGLQVTTPQSVIRPADPVLYIIPQDRPLVITAQVPPIHVDEVHVGQKVRLVFSAFSSRTTPELTGRLEVVSADALTDQKSGTSFYRAKIVLEPGELAKLKDLTLLPGMPVQAFIETEARSPLTYLIKPFTDYFKTAFRES